jgi:hypothetical protein
MTPAGMQQLALVMRVASATEQERAELESAVQEQPEVALPGGFTGPVGETYRQLYKRSGLS